MPLDPYQMVKEQETVYAIPYQAAVTWIQVVDREILWQENQ